MSFDAAIHAKAKPDAERPRLLLRRALMAVATIALALVWTSTASASCGNYLYRNGKQVTDASFSMNDHQATILESLADSTSRSGAIEIPESERGARFVPSSIFRPPAA